jgi:hypothetical protein
MHKHSRSPASADFIRDLLSYHPEKFNHYDIDYTSALSKSDKLKLCGLFLKEEPTYQVAEHFEDCKYNLFADWMASIDSENEDSCRGDVETNIADVVSNLLREQINRTFEREIMLSDEAANDELNYKYKGV